MKTIRALIIAFLALLLSVRSEETIGSCLWFGTSIIWFLIVINEILDKEK